MSLALLHFFVSISVCYVSEWVPVLLYWKLMIWLMKNKSDAEHFVMTIDWVWVKQMFFDILLPSKTELF